MREYEERNGFHAFLPPLSRVMLENVVSGLEHGPNLRYLCNYWEQVSNFTSTAAS